jgi:hypothetical protein
VYHPHPVLGKVVYVELDDVHTEPGVFLDSELSLATALLVGRCRICGPIYMPVTKISPRADIPSQTFSPYPNEDTWHMPGRDQT